MSALCCAFRNGSNSPLNSRFSPFPPKTHLTPHPCAFLTSYTLNPGENWCQLTQTASSSNNYYNFYKHNAFIYETLPLTTPQ